MAAVRWARRVVILALVLVGGLFLWGYGRNNPEDVPWTGLDLTRPVGTFTRPKLAALVGHGPRCRALLHRAGAAVVRLPDRKDGPECGYDDAVRFAPGGAVTIAYRPHDVGTSCPVAAALALWEWNVVQPAALRRLGSRVAEVETFGSYNCRRMSGRATGDWSEHARANALDVAVFRLEDGRHVTVAGDWRDKGAKGRFLHEVRDGACRVFVTTLSPDYNAAHRDHLHLDEAARGAWGWRACR
jgi:hypothetical protein